MNMHNLSQKYKSCKVDIMSSDTALKQCHLCALALFVHDPTEAMYTFYKLTLKAITKICSLSSPFFVSLNVCIWILTLEYDEIYQLFLKCLALGYMTDHYHPG